ncbi:MAG TPA: TPM domain-containing protein [Burkholderiaceae bacterium]|jgi:uncharacterized protein
MRRVFGLLVALVVASFALLGEAAHAQAVLPIPKLTARVIDQTGTLSAAQIDALTVKLAAIETKRGSQIVVLMVPTTQPEDIATYGFRVADDWKVGRRDVGDGLVIIVAKNDRRVNIEVARTLEGAVPDVLAGRIISEQIKPAFKADDYAGGLGAAIDRLDKAIGGEALPAPTAAPRAAANGGGFDLQSLGIFLLVGVPVVGGILTGVFGRKLGSLLTGGAVGGIGYLLTASLMIAGGAGLIALFLVGVVGLGGGRLGGLGGGPVIWGGGGGGRGGGFGGGGGGGFGSGGGGSFGGGGASGSW